MAELTVFGFAALIVTLVNGRAKLLHCLWQYHCIAQSGSDISDVTCCALVAYHRHFAAHAAPLRFICSRCYYNSCRRRLQ